MTSSEPPIVQETKEYHSWPPVLIMNVPEEDRDDFLRRKMAVERKIDGDSNESIKNLTGFSKQEVNRFLKRCRTAASDGLIWGYRILVPGKWIGEGERKKTPEDNEQQPGGQARTFKWLLKTYPDVEVLMINLFLAKAKTGEIAERAMMKMYIWQAFCDALRAKGLTDDDYPFYTKNKARRSVERFLDGLYDTHFRQIVKNYEGDQAARNMGRGKMGMEPPATRSGSQVELDAYRFDDFFDVSMALERYPPKSKLVKRPWFLALIDRSTQIIWSYLIVLAEEVNQYDIMRLFKRATGSWELPELTYEGLRYKEGAGMPYMIPGCEHPLFDEIYLDNALAHIANEVKRIITHLIGGTMILGPYRSPKDRPFIENFNKQIAKHCHRLPVTTGSGSDDPRKRKNAEELAFIMNMDHLFLEQFTAKIVADRNTKKLKERANFSAMQLLAHDVSNQPMRCLLDLSDLDDFNLTDTRVVRGDKKRGRRPYTQYENVRYSSENLKKTPSMLGQTLTLSIDFDDISRIEVFTEEGHFFDYLIPNDRKWQHPHTLEERRIFYRYEGEIEDPDDLHAVVTRPAKRTDTDTSSPIITTPTIVPASAFRPLSEWSEDDGKTHV